MEGIHDGQLCKAPLLEPCHDRASHVCSSCGNPVCHIHGYTRADNEKLRTAFELQSDMAGAPYPEFLESLDDGPCAFCEIDAWERRVIGETGESGEEPQ